MSDKPSRGTYIGGDPCLYLGEGVQDLPLVRAESVLAILRSGPGGCVVYLRGQHSITTPLQAPEVISALEAMEQQPVLMDMHQMTGLRLWVRRGALLAVDDWRRVRLIDGTLVDSVGA